MNFLRNVHTKRDIPVSIGTASAVQTAGAVKKSTIPLFAIFFRRASNFVVLMSENRVSYAQSFVLYFEKTTVTAQKFRRVHRFSAGFLNAIDNK